jgi:hypothetical protein
VSYKVAPFTDELTPGLKGIVIPISRDLMASAVALA